MFLSVLRQLLKSTYPDLVFYLKVRLFVADSDKLPHSSF